MTYAAFQKQVTGPAHTQGKEIPQKPEYQESGGSGKPLQGLPTAVDVKKYYPVVHGHPTV